MTDYKLAPVARTFYVLHYAEGRKYIMKFIDDGCLAIFESEEDAQRAKRRHPGTEYRRVDYYTAPQLPLQLPDFITDPDDSDEVASLWDLGFKRGWNACLEAVTEAMQPADQKPFEWPKLERPAKVGGGRFNAGVSSRLVVEAAQRQYEYDVTPEKEADRIALIDGFRRAILQPEPDITPLVEALMACAKASSAAEVGLIVDDALAAHRKQGGSNDNQ